MKPKNPIESNKRLSDILCAFIERELSRGFCPDEWVETTFPT